MTRERAKELLPIIQAYADGEIIQILRDGKWIDIINCFIIDRIFSGYNDDLYRIKPKPREFTMGIGKNGMVLFANEGITSSFPTKDYTPRGITYIKVREILE